ncbi:hypothetical protein CCANI_01040 [Corynebacterium canis]|nr:hypothetical protein CCANI_01040 [Corynebacterium canis]
MLSSGKHLGEDIWGYGLELILFSDCSAREQRVLSRGVRQGTHLRLASGVYVPRYAFLEKPPWEQHRLRAMAIGLRGGRVIGGVSAATLWKMWIVLDPTAPVEFHVVRSGHCCDTAGHRLLTPLRSGDYTRGAVCKVTTIPQTLLDLAEYHSFEACFMATTWALRFKKCSVEDIQQKARRSENLQRALDLVDVNVESAAEAYFLAQVRDGGVIDLQTQVSVVDSRAKLWRPDFQIRYTRILIEISGVGKYGETEEDQKFNVDKATDRLNRLTSQGFVVWSYSAREVFSGFAYQDVLRRYRAL